MIVGFYCATPYHIIASINYLLNCKDDVTADLFVLNHFQESSKIVQKIREQKIFRKVLFINQGSMNIKQKINRITGIIFPPKEIRSIYQNFDYDKILFFAYDFINIGLIIKKCIKFRKKCEFLYGDDGIGSYSEANVIYKPIKSVSLILQATGRKKYINQIKSLALYFPELSISHKNFNITSLPLCKTEDTEYTDLINAIWSGNKDLFENKKIIYFQQLHDEDNSGMMIEVEKSLFSLFEEMDVIDITAVKPHPRSAGNNSVPEKLIINDRRPFEVFLTNMNLNSSLLISNFSTALFMPYLMFGQTPYLIITNKLHGSSSASINSTFDLFVERFKQLPGNMDKIFTPTDTEALKEVLKKCLNKI